MDPDSQTDPDSQMVLDSQTDPNSQMGLDSQTEGATRASLPKNPTSRRQPRRLSEQSFKASVTAVVRGDVVPFYHLK